MRGEGWVEAARTLWADIFDETYCEPTAPAVNGYLDAIAWRLRNDIDEDEFSAIIAQWVTQQPADAASRLEHLLDATAAVSLAARRMRPQFESTHGSLYTARLWQEAAVRPYTPPRATARLRSEAQFMALLDRRLASTPDLVRALALTNHAEATRLGAEHPQCDRGWLRAFDRLFFALDARGRGHLHVPELGALALALAAAAAPDGAAPLFCPPALCAAGVRIAECALSVRPPAQRRTLHELGREVEAAVSAAAGVASGVAPLLDLAAAAREAVPGGEAESRSGPVPLRALRRYCAAQALDARRLRRVTRHVSRVAATAAAHWGKGLAAPENVSCMGAGVPSPWREACFRALPAGRRWALLRWFLLLYGEAVLGARTGAAGAGSEDGEDSGEWGEEEAVATVLFHGWRTWRLHALASQQGRGPRDAAVASPSAAAIAAAGSGLSADRLREALAGMWAPQCSPEQASGAPSQAGEEEQADEALVEVSGEAGPAQLRGNRDYSRILDAVTRHDEAVAAVARALATPEPA